MIYYLLINIGVFIISIIFLTNLIYQFQIKEYRFDRINALIKEQGILSIIFPERYVLPKRSVRNFNIAKIAVGGIVLYEILILLYFIFKNNGNIFITNTLLLPLISLILIIIGTNITQKISEKNRNIIIENAIKKRKSSRATFIGITGSFGKSTTKEFVYELIASTYKTAKTVGNYNTNIGVAISINEQLQKDTEYFVTEMGAYKRGEIKETAEYIKPNYAIITGLSNQHISLFGSHDNLIKAKAELIQALPNNGIVYINADSESYKEILKYTTNKKVYLYSTNNKDADIFLKEYKYENDKCRGIIVCNGKNYNFSSSLLGEASISNLLPAVAIAQELKVSKIKILETISNLKNSYGKLSKHIGINNVCFLHDGYSSNVEGFLSALEVLNQHKIFNKTVITKGILELGTDKEKSYTEILKKIEKYKIRLVTMDKMFKKLGNKNTNITLLKNENKFLEYIKLNTTNKDLILIEGRFSDKFFLGINVK